MDQLRRAYREQRTTNPPVRSEAIHRADMERYAQALLTVLTSEIFPVKELVVLIASYAVRLIGTVKWISGSGRGRALDGRYRKRVGDSVGLNDPHDLCASYESSDDDSILILDSAVVCQLNIKTGRFFLVLFVCRLVWFSVSAY